jgi:hypothetical protein
MLHSWQGGRFTEGDSSITPYDDDYQNISGEKAYSYRSNIQSNVEESSEVLLDKLEQAGRVPSKEKFRRMACNVRFSTIFIRVHLIIETFARRLCLLAHVLTVIDVSLVLVFTL